MNVACKLCGAPFVCSNGMWFTTCRCALGRADELAAAQRPDIVNNPNSMMLLQSVLHACAQTVAAFCADCNLDAATAIMAEFEADMPRIASRVQGNRPGGTNITWADARYYIAGVLRMMLDRVEAA